MSASGSRGKKGRHTAAKAGSKKPVGGKKGFAALNPAKTVHEQQQFEKQVEARRDRFLYTDNYMDSFDNDNRGSSMVSSSGHGSFSDLRTAAENTAEELGLNIEKISGTCQRLEKDYYRLTSAPKAADVRPPGVLLEALFSIQNRWYSGDIHKTAVHKATDGGKKTISKEESLQEAYIYFCSQLKAMRQDLMVQHLSGTNIAVAVMEAHARVALECSDLNEFNQCQTQLKQMYDASTRRTDALEGVGGGENLTDNSCEFLAYRLLYFIYLRGNQQYRAGNTDLVYLLRELQPEEEKNPAVQHALKIRAALQQSNYIQFFRLYRETPNLGKCILGMMLDSVRLKFLQRAVRASGPTALVVADLLVDMAFEENEAGVKFLLNAGCAITIDSQDADSSELIVNALARGEMRVGSVLVEVDCRASDIAAELDADALL